MRNRVSFVLSGLALSFSLSMNASSAGEMRPRPRIALAGEWRMQFAPRIDTAPSADWGKFILPGRTDLPKDQEGMWCERDLAVPAEWAEGRIVLRIGKVVYAASVEFNGRKVGEIPGFGAELDITEAVRFGETNTVRLFFGRGGKGNAGLDLVTRKLHEHLAQQAAQGGWDWGSSFAGVLCEADLFYLERQNPDLAIADVWYKTYTRGTPRIVPEATLRVHRSVGRVTARVVITEPGSDNVVREATYDLGTLQAGERTEILPLRADRLKTWNLLAPHLYRGQVILLGEDGRELDRSAPTLFGLREFTTHGKDWFLNGERVHFTFEWAGSDRASIQASLDKGVTLLASGIARPGSFLTMAHLDSPPFVAQTCDELGMGLTYVGVAPHWLDLADPETLRSYTRWVREHTKWLRNHPSILFWCIGMNSPGNYLDFSPVKIGRQFNNDDSNIPTTLAYQAYKEADPTRLLYFHGGPRSADVSTGNIYFNHNPTQEAEDWLSEWENRGDQPVIAVEFMGSPLEVDYLLDKNSADRLGFATEYAARTMGDAAYTAETDEYVSYVNHVLPRLKSYWDYAPVRYFPDLSRGIAESHSRVVRAWRFRGVPVFSWTFGFRTLPTGLPDRHLAGYRVLGDLENQASRPIQVWIGGPSEAWTEKDHQFHTGDTVSKSILVLRDRPGREPWTLAWEATLDGAPAPFAAGEMEFLAGPWGRARLPFSFPAPQVSSATGARITVTARRKTDGTETGRDSFAFSVHPRPVPTARRLKVGVIDPEGETSKWLAEMGVTVLPVFGPRPGLDALVLGRRALRGMESKMPFTADDLEKGLRVVIFEQHCDDLGKFGFRHEDRSPRQAFLRGTRSPLTRGLSDDMLRDWRGSATLISAGPEGDRTPVSTRLYRWGNRGSVASSFPETPHFGPFKSLIECETDLAYSPLLSFRHGRGEILYCQLDLTGRVGLDPAATLVARNIVDALAAPSEKFAPARTVVTVDAAMAKRVAELGFASVALESGSPAGVRPDPKRHVWVLDGNTVPVGAAPGKLETFIRGGGDVLVFGAGADFLSVPFLGGALRGAPRIASRAGSKADDHPLLDGVGPQNLHYREPVAFTALSSDDPNFTRLLDGLAGILKVGRGRVIFVQPDLKALADFTSAEAKDAEALQKLVADNAKISVAEQGRSVERRWREINRTRSRWQIHRLHSLVLGNLGARASDDLIARLLEVRREIPFSPVNAWVYLGPFPPDPAAEDPLATRLDEYLAVRDPQARLRNARGESVEWVTPTDSQNGMGIGGKMDLARVYGVRLMDLAIARTQIWSTRAREAPVRYGGDWWARLIVNGETVPGEGWGFEREGVMKLRAGWNEVACVNAAGSNGHWFQFSTTNPGDLVVSQTVLPPASPPGGLPPAERLLPERADTGFSLYTDPIAGPAQDPYDFIPW